MAEVKMSEKSIAIDELPSNSIMTKTEKKEVVKQVQKTNSQGKKPQRTKQEIISGAGRKKKTTQSKLAEVFFDGAGIKGVRDYVIFDIVIPACKDTISDVINTAVEMVLFGESGKRKHGRNRKDSGRSYVSYRDYYKRDDTRSRRSRERSERIHYDDAIFDNKYDAEEVLSRMIDILDNYEEVSVADFYEIVKEVTNGRYYGPNDYTENKYGWINLSNASIRRIREGYLLELPRTVVLD